MVMIPPFCFLGEVAGLGERRAAETIFAAVPKDAVPPSAVSNNKNAAAACLHAAIVCRQICTGQNAGGGTALRKRQGHGPGVPCSRGFTRLYGTSRKPMLIV